MSAEPPKSDLRAALLRVHPELERVVEAASEPVYVVGGAVRDLLLGSGRADLDLLVVGDATALARRLAAEPLAEHDRFGTATVSLDGHRLDLARARTEAYAEPGALPEVEPTDDVAADLGRRDFSVNAIAVLVAGDIDDATRPEVEAGGGEAEVLDPFGGRADLAAGLLRVLHPASFRDDPTRAIRAARYAARLGFALEPETERLLREADLATVSAERRGAELTRLAAERSGVAGLALLAEWGLIEPRPGGIELAELVAEQLGDEPWREEAPHAEAILAAALGPLGAEEELAAARPARPSQGWELAHGRDPVELVLARALGAEWLDRYLREWRPLALEIDGEALKAAGVAEGPALGHGLEAARRAKLDGEASGHEE
jgi:tRNA nucleotidyltransferase (CCA-adding enzyme)